MKKYLPYLILGLGLIVLMIVVFSAPQKNTQKLDERITLRQKDKIPYGTYVAQSLLKPMFPKASISIDKKEPSFWNEVSAASTNQAVFLIGRSFEPETYELKRLADFVNKGNYVFIIANRLSYEAANYFSLSSSDRVLYTNDEDSLHLVLKKPPFNEGGGFIYPGKKFDNHFISYDPKRTKPLGSDQYGNINFVQMQAGKGKLFIHLAPLAFSNYFILHKNNRQYFQKAVSLIPAGVNNVLWNEYYLTKRKEQEEPEPNVLRVLWQYPSFRWALITTLATLLLYVLLEMRRRQRIIPVLTKPVNDSLDFVRTMGRLYYDRNDHHNLSKKMAAHFLETVRSRYKISTLVQDGSFVNELHLKSGYPVHDLQIIVSFIQHLNKSTSITESDLAGFYQQLQAFYQKT